MWLLATRKRLFCYPMLGDRHEATVIFDTCREGSLNMALDSLLLQQLREEEQVFLRFYTWCPATVSIGLFQKWQHNNILLTRGPASHGGKLFFTCSM